jgi:glycosylphosphatidylinositol transamidase
MTDPPPEPASLPDTDTTSTEAVAQEPQQASSSASTGETQPSSSVKRRVWWPFLWLPYLIGIAWHGLHPIASVFTGQAHARGWYIDENSLDPGHFRMDTQRHYPTFRVPKKHSSESVATSDSILISPCARLADGTRNVDCHADADAGFNLVRILPVSNAVAPVSEAIVLVVPFASDWKTTALHNSLLRLMERLSTAPWLAKTILVVSPTSETISLTDCVDRFLETYQGSRTRREGQGQFSPDVNSASAAGTCSSSGSSAGNYNLDYHQQSSLPSSWTGAMIRQLLVLDAHYADTVSKGLGFPMHELRILPAGRRGVLPNMDLLVLIKSVYARCRFLQTLPQRWDAQIVVHPFSGVAREWSEWMIRSANKSEWITANSTLVPFLQKWANDVLQLVLFEYTLAVGPYPAHASALDRGIDSLTLQVHLTGDESPDTRAAHLSDYVQKMEAVIRGLSNLHERLHHSTSLYIVPVQGKFVKHEEYLVPNLLLLIPLVIRALTLALFDIPRFHLGAVRRAVAVTVAGTMAVAFLVPLVEWIDTTYPAWVFYDGLLTCHILVAAVYAAILLFPGSQRILPTLWKQPMSRSNALQSIQFIACLLAVYIHVPIAFGHVSLAFPSALFWTPWIAFPSFRQQQQPIITSISSRTRGLVCMLLLLATAPPVLLVPRIFASYTPYVKFAYLPLHLLVSFLYLLCTTTYPTEERKR